MKFSHVFKVVPLALLVSLNSFALEDATEKKSTTPVAFQQPLVENLTFSPEFTSEAISAVANQVADWQLSQFDIRSNMMRKEGRASGIPQGWMYATFDVGLLEWAKTTEQAQYTQAVSNFSKLNDWTLGPRVYHADDHAIGSVYIDLYKQNGGKEKIAHLTRVFDEVIENQLDSSLEFLDHKKMKQEALGRVFHDPICTVRWCWADAIFMAPPVWTKLAVLTGNNKYLDFMDKEFWQTTEYLFNKQEQLYLRDSRYFDRKDSKGRLIYWGRGNGWVLAGIVRVLENMPADYPQREKYITLYKNMSERLIALQQQDGSWPSSLLETETNSTPESSGTGLLVYALAWGLNNGVLATNENTENAVALGWQSLVNSVQPNGKLGWVQQVAFAPGSATEDDTQLYGTGALLLAASEVYKFAQVEEK